MCSVDCHPLQKRVNQEYAMVIQKKLVISWRSSQNVLDSRLLCVFIALTVAWFLVYGSKIMTHHQPPNVNKKKNQDLCHVVPEAHNMSGPIHSSEHVSDDMVQICENLRSSCIIHVKMADTIQSWPQFSIRYLPVVFDQLRHNFSHCQCSWCQQSAAACTFFFFFDSFFASRKASTHRN